MTRLRGTDKVNSVLYWSHFCRNKVQNAFCVTQYDTNFIVKYTRLSKNLKYVVLTGIGNGSHATVQVVWYTGFAQIK